MTKSVLVGMSGGVDSSVAAALLVEAGYRVCGAYMKNWTLDVPGSRCPWADDLADAKRTAVRLGIDFRVYDFQQAYKREVVDYLVEGYRSGRTPNPDVMCNQEVKFGLFLDAALADGFDFIATGHYARAVDVPVEGSAGSRRLLLRAADARKDQTYFLYRMSQRALDRTLLPLGDMEKPTVRKLAADRGLLTAEKADSQGICFVGEAGIREFLSMYVDRVPGPIVDVDTGKTVGSHEGAIFFTLGQRHGLGAGGGAPRYVVDKDMDRNIVFVSADRRASRLEDDALCMEDASWISGQSPRSGDYLVRMRHGGELVPASVDIDERKATAAVHLSHPCRAVASGQSVVVYQGQVCLGGGIAV
jgi:tRNA-specific 2-thiouridylase